MSPRRVAMSRCCRILRRRTDAGGRMRRCVPADARKLMRKSMSLDLQRHTTRDDLMTYWTAPAAGRPATRMAAAIAATPSAFAKTLALCVSLTAAVALVAASPAFAQQPDAAAPAAPKPPKKPKPKPPAEAQQTPAPAPAPGPAPVPAAPADAQQAPGQQGQAQNGQQQVQLIFSPWTKFCLKG